MDCCVTLSHAATYESKFIIWLLHIVLLLYLLGEASFDLHFLLLLDSPFYLLPNCAQSTGICNKLAIFVFSRLLGYLFYEFSVFWISEEPESVMMFNQVRDKFADKITELVKNPSTVLELKYKTLHDDTSLASVSTLDKEWCPWHYSFLIVNLHPIQYCM